jgi:hypothetical protein
VVLEAVDVELRCPVCIGQTIEARVEDETSRPIYVVTLQPKILVKGHGCTQAGARASSECVQ